MNKIVLKAFLSLLFVASYTANATTYVPVAVGDITIFIPVDDPPIAADDAVTADEDTTATVDLLANDSDENIGTVSVQIVSTQQSASQASVTNGVLTYTPAAHWHGVDNVVYRLIDENGNASNEATVTVTINSVNDAPVAVDDLTSLPGGVYEILPGQPRVFDVLANDYEYDPEHQSAMTLRVAQGIAWYYPTVGLDVQIVNNGKRIQVTHNGCPNYGCSTAIFYEIVDPLGAVSNEGKFYVNVVASLDPNQPPVISNVMPTQGQTFSPYQDIIISATVVDPDLDGDVNNVNFQINEDGSWWVSTRDGDSYSKNFGRQPVGSHFVDITTSDNEGLHAPIYRVNFNVSATANTPPVANPDPGSLVIEDNNTLIDVLANDTDADGDTVSLYSARTLRDIATVAIENGKIRFTPLPETSGVEKVEYTIVDGKGGSDTVAFDVIVSNFEDPPVADPITVSTSEDTPVAITLTGSDPEQQPLTFIKMSDPTFGVVSFAGNIATYTPGPGLSGQDSFTYRVFDGSKYSSTVAVTVNVNSVNDTPVANNMSPVAFDEDTSLNIVLDATDGDGDTLTYNIVTNPSNGLLTGVGANRTYTPNENFNGTDSFTFTASDSATTSNTATVTLVISPVNDSPVANSFPASTSEDTAVAISLTGSDVEDTSLNYVVVTNPGNGSLSGTAPNLTYTPTLNFNGNDSFTYKVTDTQGADSALATVSVSVGGTNDVPVISGTPAATVTVGSAFSFLPTASDDDNDPLVFSINQTPSWATFSTTTGQLSGTPQATDVGVTSSLIISVTDNKSTPVSLPAFTIDVQAQVVTTVLTSPADQSEQILGNINVSAQVSDDVQTQNVLFSLNGAAWVADADSAAPWQYTFTGGVLGNNTLQSKVINTSGVESLSTIHTTNLVLATPNVSISTPQSGAFDISWAAIAGATGYQVQEETGPNTWIDVGTVNNQTTMSITDKPFGTYVYQVRAIASGVPESAWSNWSQSMSVTVEFEIGQCPVE